ncbi:uncharacterized protein [Apostichopus japonicus]|uniref:uncharacterized protein isoform X2 n=1 Tax=Stichopus japonicus TaxID=307972 RepID=UPI003AB581F4
MEKHDTVRATSYECINDRDKCNLVGYCDDPLPEIPDLPPFDAGCKLCWWICVGFILLIAVGGLIIAIGYRRYRSTDKNEKNDVKSSA